MNFEGDKSILLEFTDNPFEDINAESSDITLKITGESHEVTEEVDGEMQTFICFPVEEVSSETKKCYDFKEPLSDKEIEVISNIQTNLINDYMNNK
jgi:hypothetical protein